MERRGWFELRRRRGGENVLMGESGLSAAITAELDCSAAAGGFLGTRRTLP